MDQHLGFGDNLCHVKRISYRPISAKPSTGSPISYYRESGSQSDSADLTKRPS